MRSVLDFYKRLDLSREVAIVRYALNRTIDVFVIGPAVIALLAFLTTWLSGGQPFQELAKGQAAIGEAFRDAPNGYVMVFESRRPDAGDLPGPPALHVAADDRKAVPVREWVQQQADDLAEIYLHCVLLGLFVVIGLRGWSVLASPWRFRRHQD